MTYTEMANMSMNQVLMRSINTSITALLPVLSILVVGAWIMGATTLEDFGLALLVGLLAGAYSSIFIATPVVAWLKEREPQYRLVHERLGRRSASDGAGSTARRPVEDLVDVGSVAAGTAADAPNGAPAPARAVAKPGAG